jgi:hypothetical protein
MATRRRVPWVAKCDDEVTVPFAWKGGGVDHKIEYVSVTRKLVRPSAFEIKHRRLKQIYDNI